jgi:hypothetical protein
MFDAHRYYHEFFLRGRPDLCRHMVRTRVKGNGMKAASNPQQEPNFYEMSPCPASNIHERSSIMSQLGFVDQQPEEARGWTVDEAPAMITPLPSPTSTSAVRFLSSPIGPCLLELPDPIAEPNGREARVGLMPSTVRSCDDKASYSGDIYFGDWPDSPTSEQGSSRGVALPLLQSSAPRIDDATMLDTGDETFFEGLKFHYLDFYGNERQV